MAWYFRSQFPRRMINLCGIARTKWLIIMRCLASWMLIHLNLHLFTVSIAQKSFCHAVVNEKVLTEKKVFKTLLTTISKVKKIDMNRTEINASSLNLKRLVHHSSLADDHRCKALPRNQSWKRFYKDITNNYKLSVSQAL